MIANSRIKRLDDHKYNLSNIEILKMSSIYGANGSGKSNIIRSLSILQQIVLNEQIPYGFSESTLFKFQKNDDNASQVLGVEFIQNDRTFYYAIEIFKSKIKTEELYESGLGKKEDKLIFERTTANDETSLKFSKEFESDKESQVLKNVIEKNLSKVDNSLFKLLTTLNNKFLDEIQVPFDWFKNTLQIITPTSKPTALTNRIDRDSEFHKYAEDIMCSFNIGIHSLKSENKKAADFFGEDNYSDLEKLVKKLEESSSKMLQNRTKNGDEILLVKENNEIIVKQLKIEHIGRNGIKARFNVAEESDGTKRLLDFVPAFKDLISKKKVFFIDEIERSIHPLLIKELVRKFSEDNETTGQLIFTTHESNLLDQEIFRQDEIWFTEKDKNGCTDLYSLSDFKEHSTIDIRKGYLNGRYGSIPFLGNLKDLNWHNHDSKE